MERKLASIQKITNIKPIIDADNIEMAQVLGWECIIKKHDFKVNDLVIYIEIDSITPDRPEFEFLRKRKFKVKTIKLRGQISQGLVLPLSILPEGKYKEGDDVTDILDIKKYDPQSELEEKIYQENMQRTNNKIHRFLSKFPWYRKLLFKPKRSTFPSFIKKTDEPRIQLFPNICEKEKNTSFIVTEKLDGQSATFFLVKKNKKFIFGSSYEFGVCSRKLHLPKQDNSSYWTIAKQYNIENVLKNIIGDEQFVVLQGEIIGTGIQGNKYKIKGYDFYAFNLVYPNKTIGSVTANNLLHSQNIKFVPILDTNFIIKNSISECVEYSIGKSVLLPIEREGIVVRNYDKNISFKIINPNFLLKNDE